MLPEVHQDVHERMTDRARRGEGAGVVSIGPDAPPAAEGAVHNASEADGHASNAARKGASMFSFSDEMDVIGLN